MKRYDSRNLRKANVEVSVHTSMQTLVFKEVPRWRVLKLYLLSPDYIFFLSNLNVELGQQIPTGRFDL